MSAKSSRRRSERRRAPRADARLSMRVEGAPEDGQHTQIVTESQNISASGVYCMSSHFLAPLSKVALTIVLPKVSGNGGPQDLIKCEGIVVRCQPTAKRGERRFELACMFSELDRTRRERIEQFVTWRNLQALRAAAGASRPRASAPRAAAARAASSGRRAATRPARAAVPAARPTARPARRPAARRRSAP